MKSLPRFSVENPVLVNLLMITILIGGTFSGLTLIREMFPESRPNQIMISTLYPGATPSEVEKGITLKIEEQIKDIEGVEKITSTITEGRSLIMVELESGFDAIEQAVDDVKAAVDAIPPEDFPEDALETQVSKFEPRFPVIMVSLYGDLDDRELKTLGDDLRDEILSFPNVTTVTVNGTRKDEISVEVKPAKLVEFGLSFMQVAESIATGNLDLPAGRLRTRGSNIAVRTLGEKTRGDDLYDIVIRSDPSGRVVTLRDVARIKDAFEDVDALGRFNAAPAVSVTLFKTPRQDAVKMASYVHALVAGKMGRPLEREWSQRLMARLSGRDVAREIYEQARNNPFPSNVSVATHSDLSRYIKGRLDLLTRNGRWGLLLVFLSLLIFLHGRVAFWVMMGLVLSIIGSLIFMKILGQSLNLISMFGLIIVLGLLVDDAIIVAEHVYSKIESGVSPRAAAIAGTEEVMGPVICAVLTTIVAFVPLMFIEGQIGDWMGVLPIIVCVALSVSLMEALIILPSHLAHGLKPLTRGGDDVETKPKRKRWSWLRRLRGSQPALIMPFLLDRYDRLLRLAVTYRYVTMGAITSLLIIIAGVVAGGHVPFVFLQKMDSEIIIADLRMDIRAPIAVTEEAVKTIERAAMSIDERRTLFTLVGLQAPEDGSLPVFQSNLGQAFIEIVGSEHRNRTSDDIVQELRDKTDRIPGADKLTYHSLYAGPGGEAVHLDIHGDRVADLTAAAEEIKSRLRSFEGVFDVVDNFDAGRPEVRVELYPSARALGLTTQSLATQVRAAFYGFEAQKIQRGDEDVRVMVRYPLASRRHIYDIESMRIATPGGDGKKSFAVPFTEVARLTEGTGYASIKRVNQRRTLTVTADVDEDQANANQIMSVLARSFPDLQRRYPGLTFEFGGQRLETTRSFGSLRYSFLIALILIYVLLAGLFKNYTQPIIVMTVIPFGLIGAVIGHMIMGYPLTMLSMIGTVALSGIVVNDSMILVTFINRRVRDGGKVFEAVVQGGKGRLRPILLTSATTVLGIAPLLSESSFQAQVLIPMAIAIAAGLIFATVLTLIVIPALYLIFLDIRCLVAMFWAWLIGRPTEAITPESLV